MKNLPKDNCTSCMACASICPKHAIGFQKTDGFYQKEISDSCVNCGLCERVCPELNAVKRFKPANVYAAHLQIEEVLQKSASGGVFAGLAKQILNRGGQVCGAAIDGREIRHLMSNDDFSRFQGSKYLQSYTADIYQKVGEVLKESQSCMFSGTPCQVAALYSFLKVKRIDIDSLYTVEVICHGVPSFSIVDMFESKYGKRIKRFVSFRDKKDGWSPNYATSVEFEDGTILRDTSSCFTRAFSGWKMLRKSCYQCRYKEIQRCADVTIGDLWGSKLGEHKDGLSLVLVNTEKGIRLLKSSSDVITLKDIKEDKYWLRGNPNLTKHRNPYKYHPLRLLLHFNQKHLSSELFRAFYSNDFGNRGILMKFSQYLDYPFEKYLTYERKRKYEEAVSDFFNEIG